MAREAIQSLDGIDRFMMSGTRATLVLANGSELDEAQVKRAIEAQGLKFESIETVLIERPAAAYVARTPEFT